MSVYSNNTFTKNDENNAWTKIFKFISPGSQVLDIGCSSGRLGAALKNEKKVHVIGIDMDEADIKLAKQNLDKAFVLNVERDKLTGLGKFDFIVMADVIEHLVDPVSALIKVKSLLKPTGSLIFSVPNMANGLIRLELLKGRFEYADWGLLDRTHLHYYDQEEIKRIFNGAGLNIQETDCTIRNIPLNLLKKQLSEIGLTPSAKFIDFMQRPEAVIFQFIGRAVPGKNKSNLKAGSKTPLDIVDKEISRISKIYNHNLEELNDRLVAQAGDLNQKDIELEKIRGQLSQILNSKGWKMLEKAHSVKHKLNQRLP